jgi:signal transduction histidine kinase
LRDQDPVSRGRRLYRTACHLQMRGQMAAGDKDPLATDPRPIDRRETDESLREERTATDQLIVDDEAATRLVRQHRESAMEQLRDVRADVDARQDAGLLPEVSGKLEQVAGNLAQAAASLSGVAESLKPPASHDVPAAAAAADVVDGVEEASSQLKETAESSARGGDGRTSDAAVARQLAEVAEGIAEVTNTIADERRDVDERVRHERRVTDRIISRELGHVESALAQQLREERRVLRDEREATDQDLAKERRHTDEAVEHVAGLLDEERRHHAHAARSFATRNEFLSIVSHDLRGPLMSISGLASLIDQHAPDDDNGVRIRGWAERVRRAVTVMERLIHDLLDFGSFEDGQLRVAAERLDIRALLQSAADAFHAVAAAKGLTLTADLPAEPVMAKYDPHRVFQVLSNLLHNAIKFTPEGGSIRLSAAATDSGCLVSVSDTGIGIPDGDLTSIFERFRQLDRSDRTGLGLGLYISLWIVEAHGGRIWAESKVGEGTTFHFTLPAE